MVNYLISGLLVACFSIAIAPSGNCYPETSLSPKSATPLPPEMSFHHWNPFLKKDWLEKLSKEIKTLWALDSGALHDETVECECRVDNKGHLLTIKIKSGSADDSINKAAVELLKKVPPIDRGYYNHRVPPYTKEVVCDDGIKRKMMAINSAPAKWSDSHGQPVILFIEFGSYPNVVLTEQQVRFDSN